MSSLDGQLPRPSLQISNSLNPLLHLTNMSTLQERIQPALAARSSSLEPNALLKPEDLASLPLNVLLVPRLCGLLTDLELDLTENLDATDLLQMLAKQQVTAWALLTAFRKRATIAQQCVSHLGPALFGTITLQHKQLGRLLIKRYTDKLLD
jgi:hypothetical protein